MKNQDEFIESEVSFRLGKKFISFIIVHNLPNISGLSLQDALENWIVRTRNDFSAESLCGYILSKNTGHVAFTKQQFEETLKKLDNNGK